MIKFFGSKNSTNSTFYYLGWYNPNSFVFLEQRENRGEKNLQRAQALQVNVKKNILFGVNPPPCFSSKAVSSNGASFLTGKEGSKGVSQKNVSISFGHPSDPFVRPLKGLELSTQGWKRHLVFAPPSFYGREQGLLRLSLSKERGQGWGWNGVLPSPPFGPMYVEKFVSKNSLNVHALDLEKNKKRKQHLQKKLLFSAQKFKNLASAHFPELHSFSKKKAFFISEIEENLNLYKEQKHSTIKKNEYGVDKDQKKYYTSYSKLSEIKLLTIGVASPLRILQWAEKTLQNGKIYGEVLNANTLHHKTFKPQKGGLFCEKIFGPLKDFECACGKVDKSEKRNFKPYFNTTVQNKNGIQQSNLEFNALQTYSSKEKANQDVHTITNTNEVSNKISFPVVPPQRAEGTQMFQGRKYCNVCDVEYTWSVIRRYQLGYIKLSSPVTHIWFLKGTPSYLSLLLDIKKRYLQFVTYCSEILTIEKSLLPFFSNKNSIFANFKLSQPLPQPLKGATHQKLNQLKLLNLKKDLVEQEGGILKQNKNTIQDKEGYALLDKDQEKNFPSITDSIYLKQNYYQLEKPSSKSKKDWSFFLYKGEIQKKSDKMSQVCILSSKPEHSESYSSHLESKITYATSHLTTSPSPAKQEKHPYFPLLPLTLASPGLGDGTGRTGGFYFLLKNKTVKQGTSILFSLLFSIYYKSLLNNIKTQTSQFFKKQILKNNNKRPYIKIILKKLPLDLYILCSLERMLHKSSIILSIQKIWEKVFKGAFLNAIKKAKLLLTKFTTLEKAGPSIGITERGGGGKEGIGKKKKNENYGSANIPPCPTALAFAFAKVKDSNKNLFLKKLKIKYAYHVLKFLQNLKNPILSVEYSTKFLQKNSIFNLEKQSSIEIEKYLIKKTEYIKKKLTNSFLNFLILDQFLNVCKANKILPCSLVIKRKNLLIKMKIKIKMNLLNFYKKFKYNCELLKPSFSSYTPYNYNYNCNDKNRKEKEGVFTSSAALLLSSPLFLRKEHLKKKLPPSLFERDGRVGWNKVSLAPSSLRAEPKGKRSHFGSIPFWIRIGVLPLLFPSPVGGRRGRRERISSNLSVEPIYKIKHEFKNKKIKLYNNIYTVSHRERWDNEKDWEIFSFFSFAGREYTDFPIYTYKNRLFSLNNSEDSFYFQAKNPKEQHTIQHNVIAQKGTEGPRTHSFYSGAGIVQQLLNEFDFYEIKKLDKQNRLLLYQLNKYILKLKKQVQIFVYNKKAQIELRELCKKRDLLIRRTKLVRKLFRKNTDPASMILTVIPVLPPDLRPIVKMGNQIAASDLNRLYQRVIYRNDRLKKFLKDPATRKSFEMKYAQRLLQEAVDNLMQNGKSGPHTEKDGRGRALKSLSDSLKGKQGRFRQFLLGKRVDYSGRSVIVVGPKLKLYECGLPVEIAKELYLPFLLKSLLNKNYAKTVVGAKTLIKKNPSLANELLREIMQVSPVLLNRAPTLHRLGIQAFIPKLIEGRAILLHPLVCSAFNADFDGDQMAVHLPITVEARAEAWKMMCSRNNILSPATGDPLAIPSQDMVLGCYYLTTFSNNGKILKGSGMYFKNFNEVIKLYEQQLLDIHSLIWVNPFPYNPFIYPLTPTPESGPSSVLLEIQQKYSHSLAYQRPIIENGNDQEDPFEIRISPLGQWHEISSNYQKFYDSKNHLITQFICTTPGRILFNLIIQKITSS